MKRIYLIRHGQTGKNINYVSKYKDKDEPLNQVGIEQATITGKYLDQYRIKKKPFDLIISSTFTRCQQTASIIADNVSYDKENSKKTSIT